MIKDRLGVDAIVTAGKTGQFEVIADGETIAKRGGNWFTRSFGAGYPELESIVTQLERRRSTDSSP